VFQFPNWEVLDPITGFPDIEWSRFENVCGFAEDLYVDAAGRLVKDSGVTVFAKNFVNRDPAPDRLTECPAGGRPDPEDDIPDRNGGIPPDLGLWWPTARALSVCDTLACSRIGVPRKWSTRLLPGDFDSVPGWGMSIPSESARDVRARGVYEATQDRGFPVWTVEMMRDMDTGNSDDLQVRQEDRRFRLVIGVFDASGRVGYGSTMVILEFEDPVSRPPLRVPRC
jgi:hypothetical protein